MVPRLLDDSRGYTVLRGYSAVLSCSVLALLWPWAAWALAAAVLDFTEPQPRAAEGEGHGSVFLPWYEGEAFPEASSGCRLRGP